MATTRLTGTLIKSGSIPTTALGGGVVTSSAQIAGLVPGGTVSSSVQIDITATTNYSTFSSSLATVDAGQTTRIDNLASLTSSYAINSTIQSQLANVVSSSTQVKPLLPGGTVSASNQVDITATTNYSTFSSSIATKNDLQDISIGALNSATSSYAINTTIQSQLAGVVSSSTQVQPLLPGGTVSSSGQVDITATANYSTFSSSIATKNNTQDISIGALNSATSSYAINATIQSQLANVPSSSAQIKNFLPQDTVSSSIQVTAFLPVGIVSSSAQYPGWVTSSTQITQALPTGTVSSSAQYPGWVTASSQIDYNTIQNKLSGTVSSSQQIQPLLPIGTVSSSLQINTGSFSGSITSASYVSPSGLPAGTVSSSNQVVWSSVNYNSGIVSSSAQVQPLLPGGTVSSSAQYPGWVTSSAQATGWTVLSASFASTASYISGNIQFNNGLDVTGSLLVVGAISASVFSGSISSPGVVSSSTQVVSSLPGGTVSSSAQYPGWVTASSQIDYNSITNKLSGVVSSSTQVQPLLPGGTVSSSGQVDITATTGYSTFSSSLATVDATQQVSLNALNAATSSYAINSAIQSQLANVVSSSAQVQPLLPGGTVSSSAQYPGWVTASSQIDYNSITNKLSGVISSSAQFNALTNTTASFATTANAVNTLNQSVSASGNIAAGTNLISNNSSGDEGGEILLAKPQTNSTITGSGVTIDVYQNKLRFFEQGGNARGGYLDITGLAAGVGTNLAGGGGTVTSISAGDGLTGGTITGAGTITVNTGSTHFSSGVVKSLPVGTVSSSVQYPGWVTASSQIDYNSITNKLSGVVSSSTQVQPLLPGGTVSSSAQYPGWVTSSAQIVVQNTTGIGALATTGSNTFTANQIITGSVFISQNLTVFGSSSISYVSQSTLNIETNKITMNTSTPGTRFGGIEVIDSGSSPLRSGSLFFDSINDQWMFIHQNTAGGLTSSVVLMGPPTFNNVGNETLLTQNRVVKSAGLEHVTDSQITDNGITVSITNGLSVGTNLTASSATISGLSANQAVFTDANDTLVSVATTGTGNVVLAGSPTITGTLTAANITATGTMLLAGIYSSSTQVDYNSIQNKLSGVVSSSGQVQPLLPGGSVSSSAQYPGWVTASSQIDYNSITNKLIGVYSSSAFTSPSQGTVRLSLNGVALTDVDTGLQTADQVTFAGVTSSLFGTASLAQNVLTANVVSSSTQVTAFLPTGTVSSSGQVDYNSITNKLAGVYSSSAFTAPSQGTARLTLNGVALADVDLGLQTTDSPTFAGLTSTGTILLQGIYSSSTQVDYNSIQNKLSAVYSSSAFTAPSQGTVRLSFNGVALTDVDTGLQADDKPLFSGSQFSGIVSGSGLQYRLVVPVGTNYYAT